MILDIGVRDELLSRLNEEQQQYLTEVLSRGRRTVFANEMARQKGYSIPEGIDVEQIELLLDEWIYTGYIDAGQVSPDLRCECGRPLRYQHQVQHKTTGERKFFGIDHLKEHLTIDASVVSAIKKGFDAIDYELDELLVKLSNDWAADPELLQVAQLPDDVVDHMNLKLPLLDKQVKKLRAIRAAELTAAWRRNERQAGLPEPAFKPEKTTVVEKSESYDLFAWQEEAEEPEAEPPLIELDYALQSRVRTYLRNGVGSARVICEMLIEEHQASDRRFLTGKPKLYPSVCVYIESLDAVKIESISPEDRSYSLTKPI
ncbi:uncharacterized protein DUF3895 [Paenibacillus cellulosilyticus]|uniref:Uncharacterized protein DUF3895 n=1 Tax=Paenibacillus cellulosilyticus TaxID=375489 RepID=A0A2V2YLS2_9BACL|nr:DUF3895 domain-containing protein [Paenibacillus cellulosilyticus]PWV95205.1 uncharacterized protein DUF3895 [Paenibacillus cellulosilyticus]QKS46045.1 DUF3895 domain-containing protein [Paenibacillus cellulosilyticus]